MTAQHAPGGDWNDCIGPSSLTTTTGTGRANAIVPSPARRAAAWARRWARFLRTSANGPLWHEHHDR